MKYRAFIMHWLLNLLIVAAFAMVVAWTVGSAAVTGFWGLALLIAGGSLAAIALMAFATSAAVVQPLKALKGHHSAISRSIGHLVDSSQLVSSASTEQAASIRQTVTTVTQMSASIRRSAEAAQKSREASDASQHVAQESQKTVMEMISSMDEINRSNNAILDEIERGYERITGIVKVINEISQKTKVINDIVFQTKLLSFNASVEAARAGEHGKGFAVVAEEIGNLAKMSGSASREISAMLNTNVATVNSIVKETSEKVKGLIESEKSKLESGIDVARRCGAVLQEAVANVTNVNKMVVEISQATQEQAEGMDEISVVMEQLNAATQQNANSAQNAAEYSAHLSSQAESFQQTLNRLRAVLVPNELGAAERRAEHVQAPETAAASSVNLLRFDSQKHRQKKTKVKAKKVAAKQEAAPAPAKPTVYLQAGNTKIPSGDSDFEDV